MRSIEFIRREKKKNKKLQAKLDKKKDTRELEQMITKLKVQIEEDKRIDEALKENLEEKDTRELEQMITKLKVQIEEDKRIDEALKENLEEKDRIIRNLEAKIVTLRKDIQKKNMQNISKVMDDIISSQKSHLHKSILGYNQTKNGSSSKTTKQETYPKSYAKTIKGDRKI
jgi:hypothetical protein